MITIIWCWPSSCKERPHPVRDEHQDRWGGHPAARPPDQNRIWCALVALAVQITDWMRMLTLARTSGQVLPHLSGRAPWAILVRQAITRLRALAQPG